MAKKSMKLGGGGRFQALKSKIAEEPGVTDPGAVAAAIGRKNYGAEKFRAMGQQGTGFAKALASK